MQSDFYVHFGAFGDHKEMHKPIKGNFNEILAAALMGSGKGKRAAIELQRNPVNRAQGEKMTRSQPREEKR